MRLAGIRHPHHHRPATPYQPLLLLPLPGVKPSGKLLSGKVAVAEAWAAFSIHVSPIGLFDV